jgi:hypothetical protein
MNHEHIFTHFHSKAAIIVVYVYGVFTLMARNFDGVDKSVLLGGIVNYFPAFSSIQVKYYIPKLGRIIHIINANAGLIFQSVFHFPHLAEFRSHCR